MRKFLFLFVFFGAVAFGATNVPDSNLIYTWGYASLMNETLQAVRGVIQEGNNLFKICLILAFIFMFFKVIADPKKNVLFEGAKISLFSLLIWWSFLYAPNDSKHRYMIFDETTTEAYMVDELPIGIGHLTSLVSRIERAMLIGMEKHYSTPDSLSMRNAGIGFSLTSMMKLPMVARSSDAVFNENMNNLVGVCYAFNEKFDPDLRKQVLNSENLIEDLVQLKNFPLTNSIMVQINDGTQTRLGSCAELSAEIMNKMPQELAKLERNYVASLGFTGQTGANVISQRIQGVADIYKSNWTNSRDMIQQFMLVNSMRDGIKNMEKMYGMEEGAMATPASIAHYNLFNQMQAQGSLAQTYLPQAKAYLTVLIVGLSWILALFSVIFMDFRHLKLYITLLLWLVLWTPILSIINYFNDISLSTVFEEMKNAGDGMAITFNSNTAFFTKIQEQSNFINYLVMATPLLAFALVKASEMGFVSIASSLSQSLQGGARVAASFQQQQAFSTRSDIAVGDNVYSSYLGQDVVASSRFQNGLSVVNTLTMGKDGQISAQSNIENGMAGLTVDNNGNVQGANHRDVNMQVANQMQQSASETQAKSVSSKFSNMSQESQQAALAETSQALRNSSKTVQDNFVANFTESLRDSKQFNEKEIDAIAAKVEASAGVGFKFFGNGASIGVSGSASTASQDEYSKTTAKDTTDSNTKAISEAFMEAATKTDGLNSSLTKSFSNSENTELNQMAQKMEQYQEVNSFTRNINENNLNDFIETMAKIRYGEETWENANVVDKQDMANNVLTSLKGVAGYGIENNVNTKGTDYYKGEHNLNSIHNQNQGMVNEKDGANIGSVAGSKVNQNLQNQVGESHIRERVVDKHIEGKKNETGLTNWGFIENSKGNSKNIALEKEAMNNLLDKNDVFRRD
ncbi:conjugal transfer protein TraG N-terminal domain-containing protein [Helicobacter pullorum]|uniref:conjugal transfer protein TraG N-terminal domain-containing protein n=1 Tax=Helicobacter pullorum TaxID=35818 RepID=UPI00243202C5|nr:conjugal transfer protein TraG N-terminal domain-containing protein [Helicobacter pullorum]